MHKRLLLLGLLRDGPLSGYELHRIVRAHGGLYADMKKANIYYLLERLAAEGLVSVAVESGTRGRRGERLVYELSAEGEQAFRQLLAAVLLDLEEHESAVDVAIVFLSALPKRRAMALLRKRRRLLAERRDLVAVDLSRVGASPLGRIAADHLLSQLDSQLDWLDRAMATVEAANWRALKDPVRPVPKT